MSQAGFRRAQFVVLVGFLFFLAAAVANRLAPAQGERFPSSIARTQRIHTLGGAAQSSRDLRHVYAQLPLTFEPNRGQTDTQVKFLARGRGYTLFLTETEVVLALSRSLGQKSQPERITATMAAEPQEKQATASAVLKMELVGANPAPHLLGLDQFPGKSNYFIGNDPKEWHTDVPQYAKVRYEGVYSGVDLVFYGNQGQLEYDFIVAAGTRPDAIALGIHGADRIKAGANGDLLVLASGQEIRLHKPFIYQDADGVRQQIAGGFVLKGKHRIGFRVATYDTTRPLIVDPVLRYSTYLGGSNTDLGRAIAVDSSGNAYVTGETFSSDFPTAGTPVQGSNGGGEDVFVAKINATGTALVYSTYLGGNGLDPEQGNAIAVDSSGNAYVTGVTRSSNFPTMNALQPTLSGPADAFVAKLNPTGSALVYSTFLGGSLGERALGIALDPPGNAYILGRTTSTDFPTLNAFQTTKGADGCQFPPCFDAFVAKINPTGSALVYATYLGGRGDENFDIFGGIAVDNAGNAYVTGSTDSPDFPTVNAFQPALRGIEDAYVAKIDPSKSGATSLVYSTYLGGSAFDGGAAIATDSSGNAYVMGLTGSSDFPTLNALQATSGGGPNNQDIFVTKLNPSGSALIYSTYLGGSGNEVAIEGGGIAVDSADNVYVTATTFSTDFPTASPFQAANAGSGDAFVTKLNAAGSALVYSTYLGGGGRDDGFRIAVDSAGSAYVTGFTVSPDFPTTPGALDTTCGTDGNCNSGPGGSFFDDAFIVKITNVVGPAVNLSPTGLSFSDQVVGTSSAARSVTLTNSGTQELSITSVTLTGANPGDFSTPADNCSGTNVKPGSTCSISLSFTPTATGTRSASLTITDNAPDSPQSVPLSGTGIVDFGIGISPSSVTITRGQAATYTVTVGPQGGSFGNPISLTCSLPSGLTLASCSLAPSSVIPDANSATSTLMIPTTAPSAFLFPPFERHKQAPLYAFWVGLPGLLICLSFIRLNSRTRSLGSYLLVGFLVSFLAFQAACGGGSSSASQSPPRSPGTPTGTFTVTVTGTSGALQRSATATLTVQ